MKKKKEKYSVFHDDNNMSHAIDRAVVKAHSYREAAIKAASKEGQFSFYSLDWIKDDIEDYYDKLIVVKGKVNWHSISDRNQSEFTLSELLEDK